MVPVAIALLLLWLLWLWLIASARSAKIQLLIAAIPVLTICAPIASYIIQTRFVPAEEAEVVIPDSDATTIKLQFFRTDYSDGSRYLFFKTGSVEVRQEMSGMDEWVHWPRTSVYLMGDGRIAVLGPSYDDYVVDPKRQTITNLPNGTSSDTWIYFGAFDLKANHRRLRFVPASEQGECTPTLNEPNPSATRPQGRFARCN